MKFDYKLSHATENKDGSSPEEQYYKSKGYDGELGIVAPNIYFRGGFEEELKHIEFHVAPNFSDLSKPGYRFMSFKSADGTTKTYESHDRGEEDPSDYQWTPAYKQCPQIAAIIDWFKVPKTRVRIFQMKPGYWMPGHTDLENEKGTKFGQVSRIFVQLNDNSNAEFGHRLITQDSDVSINLQKGQCLVFNQDRVTHSAWNLSKDRQRNLLILLVKRNEWLDNIMKDRAQPTVIDLNTN